MRGKYQLYAIVQSGASLIELLIVVSLCVLAMQLTMSLGTFFQHMMTHAALDELHAQCTYAHMKALVGGHEEKIVFDVDHHAYFWQDAKITLPDRVHFGTVHGAKGPPFCPTRPITHPVTFKDATIVFKENGVIRSGAVYITDSMNLYGYALTISVAPYAYLRRYYYDGVWHRIT